MVPSAKVRRRNPASLRRERGEREKNSEHPVSTTRYTRYANVGALGYLVLAPLITVLFVARRAASSWGCGLRTRVRKQLDVIFGGLFPHCHHLGTQNSEHPAPSPPHLPSRYRWWCHKQRPEEALVAGRVRVSHNLEERRVTVSLKMKDKCEYSFRYLSSVLIVKFRCSAHQHSSESDLREL